MNDEERPAQTEAGGAAIDGSSTEDFRLIELIGEGSTARIYRAVHRPTGRELALKVWNTATSTLSQDSRRRFNEECRVMHDLSQHSNRVAQYLWSGLAGGHPWLAMELYDGSLADQRSTGPLPVDQVLEVSDDMLAALVDIHANGLLHRDLKPANVLLRGGRAVIADFGISLTIGGWTQDFAAGTLGFVAPEVLAGRAPSVRSDLYSAAQTMLSVLPELIPSDLEAVLTRASSHHLEDRPESATALRRALAEMRSAGSPSHAPTAPDTLPGNPLIVSVGGQRRLLGNGTELLIGRSGRSQLVVADPLVSRRHVRIHQVDGRWRITDLGSTNGLWHDANQVPFVSLDGDDVQVRLGGPDGPLVDLRAQAAAGLDQ